MNPAKQGGWGEDTHIHARTHTHKGKRGEISHLLAETNPPKRKKKKMFFGKK